MAMDLEEHELRLLAALPQLIGGAMAAAGRSGPFGTGKELMTASMAVLEGARSFPENALLRAILPDASPGADRGAQRDEAAKTRDWAMQHVREKGANTSEAMIAMVLEDAAEASAILSRMDAQEAGEYRQWAMQIAERVAQAATEGGFLGFGGERLSAREQQLLDQLRTVLG